MDSDRNFTVGFCETLEKLTPEIVGVLQFEIKSVLDELLAHKVIGRDVYKHGLYSENSGEDVTRKILSVIQGKVRATDDINTCIKFLEVLENNSFLESIHTRIKGEWMENISMLSSPTSTLKNYESTTVCSRSAVGNDTTVFKSNQVEIASRLPNSDPPEITLPRSTNVEIQLPQVRQCTEESYEYFLNSKLVFSRQVSHLQPLGEHPCSENSPEVRASLKIIEMCSCFFRMQKKIYELEQKDQKMKLDHQQEVENLRRQLFTVEHKLVNTERERDSMKCKLDNMTNKLDNMKREHQEEILHLRDYWRQILELNQFEML